VGVEFARTSIVPTILRKKFGDLREAGGDVSLDATTAATPTTCFQAGDPNPRQLEPDRRCSAPTRSSGMKWQERDPPGCREGSEIYRSPAAMSFQHSSESSIEAARDTVAGLRRSRIYERQARGPSISSWNTPRSGRCRRSRIHLHSSLKPAASTSTQWRVILSADVYQVLNRPSLLVLASFGRRSELVPRHQETVSRTAMSAARRGAAAQ
jgi:hypothetical protein